jgi:UDP-N-acetylglucosamine 2-epimerase (non-hydrolysing)
LKPKVALIVGTRPDIIKMWPVYQALSQQSHLETVVIQSGQHDSLATQAFNSFGFSPDRILSIRDEDKTELGNLHSALVENFTYVFKELEKPDLVLVHGDTTTAFSASVAAFLLNIPIGHIEAGLRTSRFEYPFPEEGFRRAISRFTTLHFAPTLESAYNLRDENIIKNVFITGNTIVDSLNHISSKEEYYGYKPSILVTCHRRESYGLSLKQLCDSIIELSKYCPVVWPVHSNPKIKNTVIENLDGIDNIYLVEPESYEHFINRLITARLVITDSGGVMEEAAVLGKPTLVLRTESERPEVLALETIKLIGYNFQALIKESINWLNNPPKEQKNTIFGNGTAGIQIVNHILNWFNKMEKNG